MGCRDTVALPGISMNPAQSARDIVTDPDTRARGVAVVVSEPRFGFAGVVVDDKEVPEASNRSSNELKMSTAVLFPVPQGTHGCRRGRA